MKTTQKQRVLKQMRDTGSVTRNWALSQFISRLGAIVCSLKKEGMNIEAEWKEGDYIYKLLDVPQIKEYYVNGKLVATKKLW